MHKYKTKTINGTKVKVKSWGGSKTSGKSRKRKVIKKGAKNGGKKNKTKQ